MLDASSGRVLEKGIFERRGGVAPLNAKVLTGVDRATIITLSVLSETLHPPR